jgi:hypothetical protein
VLIGGTCWQSAITAQRLLCLYTKVQEKARVLELAYQVHGSTECARDSRVSKCYKEKKEFQGVVDFPPQVQFCYTELPS